MNTYKIMGIIFRIPLTVLLVIAAPHLGIENEYLALLIMAIALGVNNAGVTLGGQ